MEHRKYDEDRELPSPWEWVIITLFSASLIAFGLLVYRIVPDGPRHWDVGQLPDTPAEYIYSTEQPWTSGGPQRQSPRLPEAQTHIPSKPRNEQQRERRVE